MIRELLLEIASRTVETFPFLRKSPESLKRLMRNLYPRVQEEPAPQTEPKCTDDYECRLAKEREIFASQEEVHDLPEIFHYWSNRYIRPQMEQFGFSNPDEFFALFLQSSIEDMRGEHARIASVGPGNCDTEVRVARLLLDRGVANFTIECLDINEVMLGRGAALAREYGVDAQIVTKHLDFNQWNPEQGCYAAVMANQSLHHVLELESLFDAIGTALSRNGRFITSDMIGRNGHMRWPEAMRIVHEYWRELPESYRWNVQLQRHEELHENWDCSRESFEGIRAQDILPLLIENFSFELFLPFGNIVEPFVGRGFGGHFDVDAPADRAMIDRIHERDVKEILAGTIKPTSMLAVLRHKPGTRACKHPPGLTPEFCVRGQHPAATEPS